MCAVGLSPDADHPQESLEAIAAGAGVSRETVRRAKNELIQALEAFSSQGESLAAAPRRRGVSGGSNATGRALRRLLTMTGPLAWDEVLSAWARAGGKPPYGTLPAEIGSLRSWAQQVGGLNIDSPHRGEGPATVSVRVPEDLDQVSQFLYITLRNRSSGLDRATLLGSAGEAGLKASTVATALSHHPAIVRPSRGMWALRGHQEGEGASLNPAPFRRHSRRTSLTAFSWADDGSLVIEFSVPHNPSPVIAVPRGIADLIEGREFLIDGRGKPVRVAVGNARLWGFGPLVAELGLSAGQRVRLTINLLTGKANFGPADRNEVIR